MKLGNVIVRPLITEKSTSLTGINQYCFEVAPNAGKSAVRNAVEDAFKVDVVAVKTLIVPGKTKRMLKSKKLAKLSKWKKAFVTLKKGQSIGLFETKSE